MSDDNNQLPPDELQNETADPIASNELYDLRKSVIWRRFMKCLCKCRLFWGVQQCKSVSS